VQLDLAKVQTNIVVFELAPPAPDAATFVAAAAARGVQVLAFGLRTVRATTHMNVSRTACEAAAVALRAVLDRA
jgi:threonine aldolase